MAASFDLFDQAVLTDVVNKPLQTTREDQAFLGDQLAPLTPIQARRAKILVYDVQAFGLGQFKAPDGTMPLYKPTTTFYETLIELALLEEGSRIDEEQYIQLESPDEQIRRAAGLSIVERARILQLRNERLTEWMRWQAFTKGELVVTYPTGQQIWIDYGLAAAHKPTAAVLWSDVANADPVADVQAWSEQIATSSGHYGVKLHMTSKVWDYLIRNTKVKNMLNFYSAGANTIQRPRREDIMQLLESFAAKVDIIIYDNGYRAEGVTGQAWPGSLTKYLPDERVLLTTEYVVDGQRIADTLDGQVIIGDNPAARGQVAQGPQSELLFDHISKVHLLRQASARMPRILAPECFVTAKIAA